MNTAWKQNRTLRMLLAAGLLVSALIWYRTEHPDLRTLLASAISVELQFDSVQEIELSAQRKLVMVMDQNHEIRCFTIFRNKEVESVMSFPTRVPEEEKVDWHGTHGPGDWTLLMGRFMSPRITRVEVADLQAEEVHLLEYQGEKLFYTTVPAAMNLPITVKAFDREGRLLYSSIPRQ